MRDLLRFRADVDDFRFGSVTPGGGGLGREDGDADGLLGFGDDGSDGGLSPAGSEGGLGGPPAAFAPPAPGGGGGFGFAGVPFPPFPPFPPVPPVPRTAGSEGGLIPAGSAGGLTLPPGLPGGLLGELRGVVGFFGMEGRRVIGDGFISPFPPAGRLLPNAALGGGGGGGAPLGLKASGGGGGGAPAPPPAGTDALCRWAFADAICCIR